ncbi:MAG: PKD domain-containing protein [Cytophagia bacterium]|nr:PKD domain-containing protein [Cytophagia bacterium]
MIRHLLPALLFIFPATLSFAQTVDFTANVTSGCAPLTVQFQDATTGSASSWLWNLGKNDGSTSTLQNPSAIYTEPGTYTIVLTVNGAVSKTKVAFIQVFAKPTVNWATQLQGTCSPVSVNFTDQSTAVNGTLTEWLWLFGDGASSTVQSPNHVYENAGTYSVTLAVKNSHGCQSTFIKNNSIVVPGVTAQFSANREKACTTPTEILFTNNTVGSNLSYEWNFGDQTTSNIANPAHTFQLPGNFEVTLTVRDANQCTGTFKKIISIANEGGIDFTPSVLQACIGATINLTEATDKVVLSRQWSFGNNQLSSSANPSISYAAAGIYTKIEIFNNAVPLFSQTQQCERKILFDDESTNAVSIQWNFGDGNTSVLPSPQHQYATAGTYEVTLTATNNHNCVSVLKKNIVVAGDPIAAFSPFEKQNCALPSLSGCAPFTLPLENRSISDLPIQSLWTFSDNTQSTQNNLSKTFNTKGVYEVLLRITNTLGCTDTTKAKVYVADVRPTANFTTDKISVCVNEVITFTDQSQNSNFSCWNFGDENSGTGSTTTHSYSVPGLYTVTLTAKNDGCAANRVKTNLIEVKDPGTDFTLEKDCADPFSISLTNTSTNYNSIEWDLGDGTTSNAESFTHTYPIGNYTVALTASNSTTGCSISKETNFVIQNVKADFNVSNANVCKGESVQFIESSDFAVQWLWSFSDGTTSAASSPTKQFANPGSYNATLTVIDSDGCTDQMQKAAVIQVIDISGNFTYNATSTCDEMTVAFTDLSVANPPVTQWRWLFGDGQESNDRNAVNTYDQQGTYNVTLELTNAMGMCSLVRTQAIVFTNPVAEFSAAKNQLCAGETILLNNQSQRASQFLWDLGDGRTLTDFMPTIQYEAAGQYDVSLTVKDNYGCEITVIKPGFLNVKKPVAAFEAKQTSAECPPLIATFLNRSSADVVSWQWHFGDGQQSTLASPLNTYRVPGTFDVTLQVTDNAGCTSTTTQADIVSVGGPFGTIQYPTASCILDTLIFTAITNNAVTHRWDFADGEVKNGGTTETHSYTNAGTYKPILLLIDDKGCQVALDNGPQTIAYDKPKIDFTIKPHAPFTGEPVLLMGTYEQPAVLTWQWLTNEIVQDTVETLFEQAQNLEIKLSALDEHGCANTLTKSFVIQQALDFLPNVFTPNEDGKNDAFIIPAVYDGSWSINIYNRWGNLVYTSNEYQNNWTGQQVASGVYFFELSNNLRKEYTAKGFVHVIHK